MFDKIATIFGSVVILVFMIIIAIRAIIDFWNEQFGK